MKPEAIAKLVGMVVILLGGALYGYRIGTVGNRRSWSDTKIRVSAAFPILVPGLIIGFASLFAGGDDHSDPAWVKFPWQLMVGAGFLAMLIAVKIARKPPFN